MKIEQDRILEKQINTFLNKILSVTNTFLKKYESPELQNKIDKFIYNHNIYKNRDKIKDFSKVIMNAGGEFNKKLIEIQENTENKQKRRNELNKINTILSNYNQNILSEGDELNNIKLLQPNNELSKEESNNKVVNIISNTSEKEENNNIEKVEKNEKIKFLQKKTKLKNENNDFSDNNEEESNSDNNKPKKKIYFTNCYICKEKFSLDNIHKFYGNLCTKCGNYNYSFREMKLDFSGRIAIVTGGRIKIGYYIATKLLSYGCKVLVTSRFPKDTLFKYQQNPDYQIWKNNLIIYPIDFRIFESTVKFVNFIKENFPYIDIIINNAAQTLRRTVEYYKYLMPIETKELNEEDEKKIIKTEDMCLHKQKDGENINKKKEQLNSLIPLANKYPEYKEILPLSVIASQIKIMEENEQSKIMIMGNEGQPYDFSKGKSSWSLEFDEISLQEFTEVQIINLWTPYYLCSKLKPLMLKSPYNDRYIVNVSSPEGVFIHKKTTHVHTNMAKAALNMFTYTCAKYLKKDGIYMTCVDTGWITHMKEMKELMDKEKKENYEKMFVNVPLDELDGAMRVLHPIIEGIKNKNYLSGILLRNYTKSNW